MSTSCGMKKVNGCHFNPPRRKILTCGLFGVYLTCLFLVSHLSLFHGDSAPHSEAETVHSLKNDRSSTSACGKNDLIFSTELDSRQAWKGDQECQRFLISHMVPKCRAPTALASYPGSGNTWVRYLLEAASGIFTGSRYKDLQLQIFGFWGEIRNWKDGTTILQKTHDASEHHVLEDFGGRGILILRNPYDAILSTHNFLYAGHHAKGPVQNYQRKDWEQFVTIQFGKWIDMATNWTVYSNPQKVYVLHYENLKIDLKSEMKNVLKFLGLPMDEKRLDCLTKHSGGYFHRKETVEKDLVIPFPKNMRQEIDKMIVKINEKVLKAKGYAPMPLRTYKYFQSEDDEILKDEEKSNLQLKEKIQDIKIDEIEVDRVRGTQMVLKEYLKWLESEEKLKMEGKLSSASDDGMTLIMKNLLKVIGKPKDQESMTKLASRAEVILSMAVEWWPRLQRPFAKDPIQDAIDNDGDRWSNIKDIQVDI